MRQLLLEADGMTKYKVLADTVNIKWICPDNTAVDQSVSIVQLPKARLELSLTDDGKESVLYSEVREIPLTSIDDLQYTTSDGLWVSSGILQPHVIPKKGNLFPGCECSIELSVERDLALRLSLGADQETTLIPVFCSLSDVTRSGSSV